MTHHHHSAAQPPRQPRWLHRTLAGSLIAGSLAIAPASLAQSTSFSAECGQVLSLANETGDQLVTVFRDAPDPGLIFDQVATITGTTADTYAAMTLTDPQLQAFQTDFVTVYSTISDVSRRLYSAEQTNDQETVQATYDEFRVAIRPERPLIQATLEYCVGPTPSGESETSPAPETAQ